jgi:hypothetical protein
MQTNQNGPAPIELDCVSGAKLLREMLKDAFPCHRFSVTSSRYSGGSSISVRYTDGPPSFRVSAIAGELQGKGFDGMTDCSYSVENVFTHRGQRYKAPWCYVSTQRTVNDQARAAAIAMIEDHYGKPQDPYNRARNEWQALSCAWIDGATLRFDEIEQGLVNLGDILTHGPQAIRWALAARETAEAEGGAT